MSHVRDDFFIITGGPGSGKTSVIKKLKEGGICCVEEAGRKIIQVQTLLGGPALPWKSPQLYSELQFHQDVANYLEGQDGRLTIFDRGIADTIGYLTLNALPVPPYMRAAVADLRYNDRVFITPPWPSIYNSDAERRQDYAESVRTHDAMVVIYREAGYQMVPVPQASIADRAAFIIDKMSTAPRSRRGARA
jgi:predicted ATPase